MAGSTMREAGWPEETAQADNNAATVTAKNNLIISPWAGLTRPSRATGTSVRRSGWPGQAGPWRFWIQGERPSERNLVIHLVALEAGRSLAGAAGTAAAVTALGIQHGQLAAEILQHDLGRVFLGAVLVGPFAGLELALDIDLGALAQVF